MLPDGKCPVSSLLLDVWICFATKAIYTLLHLGYTFLLHIILNKAKLVHEALWFEILVLGGTKLL